MEERNDPRALLLRTHARFVSDPTPSREADYLRARERLSWFRRDEIRELVGSFQTGFEHTTGARSWVLHMGRSAVLWVIRLALDPWHPHFLPFLAINRDDGWKIKPRMIPLPAERFRGLPWCALSIDLSTIEDHKQLVCWRRVAMGRQRPAGAGSMTPILSNLAGYPTFLDAMIDDIHAESLDGPHFGPLVRRCGLTYCLPSPYIAKAHSQTVVEVPA